MCSSWSLEAFLLEVNHFSWAGVRLTLFCLLFLSCFVAEAAEPNASPEKRRALYGSLDKRSIAQHLALYRLYPDSPEGKTALRNALQLLQLERTPSKECTHALVCLVNKQPSEELPALTETDLQLVENLAMTRLANRRLAGSRVWTEGEVLKLPPEETDLARGLLISELGDSPNARQTIRTYEAMLDLMALQLLARLGADAAPHKKIRELNRLVFETMNYRFPPKSQYADDIHRYTFLPTVLHTRRGVCLGVSILYASLAQRLGLPLELVTPPGHIYPRYRSGDQEINVETTLRGVHIDTEEYCTIDTRQLQQYSVKETIGLAHINEASVHFQNGGYDKALAAYQKAQKYLPDDPHLKELMGYTYILLGENRLGRKLLKESLQAPSPYTIGGDTLAEDVLANRTDVTSLKVLFASYDETAEALEHKRTELQRILEKQPNFRSGWLHLGTTLLQLSRNGEALDCFIAYHELDPDNLGVEFALAELHAERLNYPKAWEHMQHAEELAVAERHTPRCLKEFRRHFALRCPE